MLLAFLCFRFTVMWENTVALFKMLNLLFAVQLFLQSCICALVTIAETDIVVLWS